MQRGGGVGSHGRGGSSRHSERKPGGRRLQERPHTDAYLQRGPAGLAQKLWWEALRDATSLEAGQTALVGRHGLGAPRIGGPAGAGRGLLGFAQTLQVPISGHGCTDVCWLHRRHLFHGLPGRGRRGMVHPSPGMGWAALSWEPCNPGHQPCSQAALHPHLCCHPLAV